MRLSEIIRNPNYLDTFELMFFHGTSTKHLDSFISNGIRILKNDKDKKKDFGQGFYLTTQYWQAKEYANHIANMTNTSPLVIACVIPLGQLRHTLPKAQIIDEFNVDWLRVIIQGRFFSDTDPLGNHFDWIYGRCGDGKTRRFEKIYKKDEKQDLESLLPHILPSKDKPNHEFDQLWLGTNDAIKCIQSVEFLNKEGVSYEQIPIHQ